MNRSELVDKIEANAKEANIELTKKQINDTIGQFMQAVTGALADGDKVVLTGFGTFEVRERSARVGRNPRTGESVEIPATRVPAFHAGKTLRDSVKD